MNNQNTGPALGNLVGPDERQRDCVHVPIAPVTAAAVLRPGQEVGFSTPGSVEYVAGLDHPAVVRAVGIVDPFLKCPVKVGERFYACLPPGTVTALRHVWAAPDWKAQLAKALERP